MAPSRQAATTGERRRLRGVLRRGLTGELLANHREHVAAVAGCAAGHRFARAVAVPVDEVRRRRAEDEHVAVAREGRRHGAQFADVEDESLIGVAARAVRRVGLFARFRFAGVAVRDAGQRAVREVGVEQLGYARFGRGRADQRRLTEKELGAGGAERHLGAVGRDFEVGHACRPWRCHSAPLR